MPLSKSYIQNKLFGLYVYILHWYVALSQLKLDNAGLGSSRRRRMRYHNVIQLWLVHFDKKGSICSNADIFIHVKLTRNGNCSNLFLLLLMSFVFDNFSFYTFCSLLFPPLYQTHCPRFISILCLLPLQILIEKVIGTKCLLNVWYIVQTHYSPEKYCHT